MVLIGLAVIVVVIVVLLIVLAVRPPDTGTRPLLRDGQARPGGGRGRRRRAAAGLNGR